MNDEEIIERFKKLENRLKKVEDKLKNEPKTIKQSDFESKLVTNIDKIPIQHLVIIALRQKENQTRVQLKNTLEEWGKVVGKWFRGGNMQNRLIKTNIVNISGQDEKKKDIYKLSKKGELLADELIKKIYQ